MGHFRWRDAAVAGGDVVPRRSLAQLAMVALLDAWSKHDLGPLWCGGAHAPPQVPGWRPWTELRLDRMAAAPLPESDISYDPVVLYMCIGWSTAARQSKERCGRFTGPNDCPFN
jgi:hypothetical protein